jgi:hypothetical protein
MEQEQVVKKLKQHFLELWRILKFEGEDNWIQGVAGILGSLDAAVDPNQDVRKHLLDAKSAWQTMNGGYGSFSDFVIWRDDYDERGMANNEFENVKKELSDLFALVQ